jgi:putative membrane protein
MEPGNPDGLKSIVGEGSPDPRVAMAAERTLLAWIRTGLAMMGFGFVVARFGLFLRELAIVRGEPAPDGKGGSLWIGVGLVALGVWVVVTAAVRHRGYLRALAQGKSAPPGQWFGIVVAALLVTAGVTMAAYLLSIG